MSERTKSIRPAGLKTDFEHGTRSRYVMGCRCDECKKANRLFYYQRVRRKIYGDWNGLVPAGKVRQRLKTLSRKGMGYKTVAKKAGVGKTILAQVMSGRRQNIRARTERKVLAVSPDALADHALVDATKTWKCINKLLQYKIYNKKSLARVLGSKAKSPALQIGKDKVLAKTARKIEKLYENMKEYCCD